jgi:transposase
MRPAPRFTIHRKPVGDLDDEGVWLTAEDTSYTDAREELDRTEGTADSSVHDGQWDDGLRALPLERPPGPNQLRFATNYDERSPVSIAFCGIDWADDHHDVAIIDQDGGIVAQERITDDLNGFSILVGLLADHESPAEPVPVAIETSRGLLVSCLRVTGRVVYAINPLAAARYRDRHSIARRKSDRGDALVLANILRTDRHQHRPLPADSEEAQAVAVLARAQQDAAWDRVDAHNALRTHLHQYFPGFLSAFTSARGGIMRPEARAILAKAPTPALAAKLTTMQLESLLKHAGRVRNVKAKAVELRAALRAPQLHQLPSVEEAMGRQAIALLRRLDTACTNVDELAEAAIEAFERHPDAEIITSFPGLGPLTGARVLGEIGDDRTRFTDARGLKAYAGAAPITRASGKSRLVLTRRVKNQRLAAAGYHWAFSSLTRSPGASAHYQQRRRHGDAHVAAQRHLFNRLLGCLHHCLQTGSLYNEEGAFPATAKQAA